VVADEVRERRWDQGSEPTQELHRLEDEARGTVGIGPGPFQVETDSAVAFEAEALLGKGRPHAVAAEFFQADAIIGRRGGVGMERETVEPHGPLAGAARVGRFGGVVGQLFVLVGPGRAGHMAHGLVDGAVEYIRVGLEPEVIVEAAAFLHEGRDAADDLLQDAEDVLVLGHWKGHHSKDIVLGLAGDEDRVGRQHMEVHVCVHSSAEALDERHAGAPGIAVPGTAGHAALVGVEGSDDDAKDGRDEFVVSGHQAADGPREGEGPLPVAALRQHHVHEIGCLFAHASGGATWALQTTLAAEGQQAFESASRASDAREAQFGGTARDKAAQLVLDVLRIALTTGAVFDALLEEGQPVLAHHSMQHSVVRLSRSVLRRKWGRRRAGVTLVDARLLVAVGLNDCLHGAAQRPDACQCWDLVIPGTCVARAA